MPPNLDVERNVKLYLWKGGESTSEARVGNPEADADDISAIASKIQLTDNKLTVTLAWSVEFAVCGTEPQIGEVLSLVVNDNTRFLGRILSMDSFFEARGQRTIQVTCRLRDGSGSWKGTLANSPIYNQGASLSIVAPDIASRLMGIDDGDIAFTGLNFTIPHTNVQFVHQSPWSMLDEIMFASGQQLFVDSSNRMRSYSKDLTRESDLTLTNSEVVLIGGQRERLKVHKVRINWLDPLLRKVTQQTKKLHDTTLTFGFFKSVFREDIFFSRDGTQRAENTFMKIVDSINATGYIEVGVETYEQKDQFYGVLKLNSNRWTQSLYGMAAVTYMLVAAVPDGIYGVETISIGRLVQAGALVIILLIMMAVGIGRYEIWGDAFDFVHATNTTMAKATNVDLDIGTTIEKQSQLILNEGHAQQLCLTELVYQNAKAFTFDVSIVDRLGIEVGQIIEMETGVRFLVTGFSGDFSRNAAAVLKLTGFRV